MFMGSFPGEESLRKQEYYGHPQNKFWHLVGDLIGEGLVELSYKDKTKLLLKKKIGVWDVFYSCYRKGSSDTNIKKEEANDFYSLKKIAPKLKTICFNGRTSGKFAKQFQDLGYKTIILQSSSPRNAKKYEVKLRDWSHRLSFITSTPKRYAPKGASCT